MELLQTFFDVNNIAFTMLGYDISWLEHGYYIQPCLCDTCRTAQYPYLYLYRHHCCSAVWCAILANQPLR